MLSADLMGRIKSRAANPKTRTDVPDPTTMDTSNYALKVGNVSKILAMGLGAPAPEPVPRQGPTPLAEPVSSEQMARAEQRIGFALPEDLKQLYSGIADGGFGPGGGPGLPPTFWRCGALLLFVASSRARLFAAADISGHERSGPLNGYSAGSRIRVSVLVSLDWLDLHMTTHSPQEAAYPAARRGCTGSPGRAARPALPRRAPTAGS